MLPIKEKFYRHSIAISAFSAKTIVPLALLFVITADTTQKLSAALSTALEPATSNVQAVASAAEELCGSVGETGRQVGLSSKAIHEAVQQAEETNGGMVELSEATNRIGDVVDLITAIAEQTDMPALNPTIAAAVEAQGAATRDIARNVRQASRAAAQVATNIADVGRGASEAGSASVQVLASAQQLDKRASDRAGWRRIPQWHV